MLAESVNGLWPTFWWLQFSARNGQTPRNHAVSKQAGLTKGRVWIRPCHKDLSLLVNSRRLLLDRDKREDMTQPVARLIGVFLIRGSRIRIVAASRKPLGLI